MFVRTRRLRKNALLRDMVKNTDINVSQDLIYPLFIAEGENIKEEIASMPGQYRYSLDNLEEELRDLLSLGIRAILLFGIPLEKDELGSGAYAKDGIVQKTIRFIKDKFEDKFLIITDVCMCEYTSHGHCGVLHDCDVENDKSLKLIARTALSHVEAGADIVAPSDMMDGRILAIRKILDDKGYYNIPIMSYSVKYSSAFYGPFRDAAGSAPSFGDRKTYQMDFRNSKEFFREIEADEAEGADFLMVKPALSYLDVVKEVAQNSSLPLVVYNVSGEYSMIKAAALNKWIDEEKVVMEIMHAFKRAGADIIITYHAKDIARWMQR